jgi:hypothetical protein
VVLRAAAEISPKIVQKGKKVYMEFPEMVKDVTLSDEKGNKLQQFKQGKRFDVTESVLATKAGHIKVSFTPPEKLYAPGPPSGGTTIAGTLKLDIDVSDHLTPDFLKQEGFERVAETRWGKPIPEPADKDTETIENGEPANDDVNGATLISSAGLYQGTVGGDDPVDYLELSFSGNTPGTLVYVWCTWGVKLTLMNNFGTLAGPDSRVWVAPDHSIHSLYLKVEPISGQTQYDIKIEYNQIVDSNEPNDDCSSANITLGVPAQATLCQVYSPTILAHDVDCYKLHLTSPVKLRITINNVGLPAGHVLVGFYTPDCVGNPYLCPGNTLIASTMGTNNNATLDIDLPSLYSNPAAFPSGDWKVAISAGQDDPDPYGTGVPPDNYEPYTLLVEEIP